MHVYGPKNIFSDGLRVSGQLASQTLSVALNKSDLIWFTLSIISDVISDEKKDACVIP